MFDEEAALKKAKRRAYYLSRKYGRKVARPAGNLKGGNPQWIHQPLRWADTGEPVTEKEKTRE